MQTSTLGIWPFDSEADKNLDQAVEAVAVMVKDRVWPQLNVAQKTAWSVVDVYRAPWEEFVENYMTVARALGKPYTTNTEYYTVWEPRLRAMGWDKDILEKLMAALRTLNAEGRIPQFVMNPAHAEPPGSKDSPWDKSVPWYLKPGGLLGIGIAVAATWVLLPRAASAAGSYMKARK